jgi:hypothetical protein
LQKLREAELEEAKRRITSKDDAVRIQRLIEESKG